MNTTCSSVSNSLLCLPARAVGGRAARTALPRSTTRASPSHLTRASLAADKSMKRGDIEEYFFGAAWEQPEWMHMMAQQALSAGVMASTLPASGLPAELRLAVLTYCMASTVEWAFHKFNMHETDDVHILHHAETNRDMSMPEDYNITAIQFPRSASLMIAAGGVPLLATLDALFQLNIPYWEVVPASMLVALTHAGLWNTLHPDSHDVILADDERMSDSNGAAYIQWLSDALGETAVYKWLILNHTGHHVIRGNYNCVFPGADNAFGTFYSVKGDAAEVTK